MKLNEEQSWIVTTSLMVLGSLAVGLALHQASGVFIPFVLAIFVTVAIAPLVDFQVIKFGWPKALSVITTMALVFVGLFLFILLLAASGNSMVQGFDKYSNQFTTFTHDMFKEAEALQASDWGKKMRLDKLDLKEFQSSTIDPLLGEFGTSLAKKGGALIQNILTTAVLTTIFVAFILAGRDPRQLSTGIYKEIDSKIRRYIVAKVVYSGLTGILVWFILTIIGLPMASMFGLFAFFLNFIPSIGSIIAWLLPVPIALLSLESVWAISAVIIFPGIVQIGIGNGLEPKAMGDDLDLHPVTILIALSIWGIIWGIMGMVLAVPITASIRVILMRFETTHPIGEILAGRLPES